MLTESPQATAATDLTGGSGAAVAPPPLAPNEARERLAITLGAVARSVADLKQKVAAQGEQIKCLEKDAATAREWIDKYKPLIEKFMNGPGRVLLKV